ncbi:MAG: hypothetical protein HY590_06750 [Candidatus Omnitrophica bacterium]|nr:hypothetical protein [Candidatus Omnitrophota bacterium]
MAHKHFEEDDPFELIAAGPFGIGEDALEEMARTFIDEYARMGWNREQLLKLFQDPFYQGPHRIYQVKGEPFIQQFIFERLPENRPLCNACPVGQTFGKIECPIRRRTHHFMDWLKARFLRRLHHA